MIRRKGLFVLAAAAGIVACEGFKEAMTAHVDVAARAASQELSSQKLADVVTKAKLPAQREVLEDYTRLWVSYQLLGNAAAHNDTLTDRKAIDEAMWGALTQAKMQRFFDTVSKTLAVDSGSEASYNAGSVLVARHILLLTQGKPPEQADSIRRAAQSLRAQVTPANFDAIARRSSEDRGSASRGGLLPPFRTGEMVPEFEQATRALQPGQISDVIQSQFGYHIIQRLPYSAARAEWQRAYSGTARRTAESTYVAQLENNGNIKLKKDIAGKVKEIARDPDAARKDKTVLATSAAGDFTSAHLVRWMSTIPPQSRPQIAAAPDSMMPEFVKAMVRNELMLRRADSMHIDVDSTDRQQVYQQVPQFVVQVWQTLGVDPKQLADSGKTVADRERIAGERVSRFLDEAVSGQRQLFQVPDELTAILRSRYESKIVPQGIDRALERAKKAQTTADSAGRANRPPSQVPLPGAPQGGRPGASPQGTAPQGAAPQGAAPGQRP
ncbi:MAG TPA: peptidylprolyl isomerase [Gemmatimonadaceae bacterium]|nr:peptidylprolyl isomerase [Gemmatimonadaceae bacterium]